MNRLTRGVLAAAATICQADHPELLAEIVRHASIHRARSVLTPIAADDFAAALLNARFQTQPRKLNG